MALAAYAVAALSLGTMVTGLTLVVLAYEPIPFEDFLDFLRRFRDAGGWGGYGLDALYARHNEHRLVVPRLWFLADLWLVEGRQSLLIAAIAGTMAVMALLLAVLARRLTGDRRAALVFGLMALAGLLSPVQAKNMVWGFQIQFVQVWLFAALAFVAVGYCRTRGDGADGWHIAIGIGGGVVLGLAATYTMANGVLVWPLLVALALWRRLPVAAVAALLLIGGTVCALEIGGFEPHPGHGDPVESLARPMAVLHYTLRYLTSSIALVGTLGQEAIGMLLIVFLAFVATRALARRPGITPTHGVLLVLAGFLVASAVVTALGRVSLGIGQANSMRYATPSMLFLLVAAALAVDHWARLRRPAVAAGAMLAGAVLLLVPGLVDGIKHAPSLLGGRDARVAAVSGFLAGADGPEALRALYPPDPAVAAEVLMWLDREALGPFSVRQRYRAAAE